MAVGGVALVAGIAMIYDGSHPDPYDAFRIAAMFEKLAGGAATIVGGALLANGWAVREQAKEDEEDREKLSDTEERLKNALAENEQLKETLRNNPSSRSPNNGPA